MSAGFGVGDEVLTDLATSMSGASQTIEDLAGGVPTAPDAGAATATIARMLADLVGAAGALSIDALESADRLTTSASAYTSADAWAAADLPTLD